jgi:hypothetical protein
MRTSYILSFILASYVNALAVPRMAHLAPVEQRGETTVQRGLRETLMPGRVRIDDIVEMELTK